MYQVTVFVGAEKTRDSKAIDHVSYALAKTAIMEKFSKEFGGVTHYNHVGSWLSPTSGLLVSERGDTFTAIFATTRKVEALAAARRVALFAKQQLEQEAVLFTAVPVEGEFV